MADENNEIREELTVEISPQTIETFKNLSNIVRNMRQDFGQINNDAEGMSVYGGIMESSLARTEQRTDNLRRKIETVNHMKLSDPTDRERIVGSIDSDLADLKAIVQLQTSEAGSKNDAFNVLNSKNIENSFNTRDLAHINAVVPRIASLIRKKMNYYNKNNQDYRHAFHDITGLTNMMLNDKGLRDLLSKNQIDRQAANVESLIRSVVANVVPTFLTDEYSNLRYGHSATDTAEKDLKRKSPIELLPNSFKDSFKNQAFINRRSSRAEETKWITTESRKIISNLMSSNSVAVKAALSSRIANRGNDGVLRLKNNIGFNEFEAFREALWNQFTARVKGIDKHKVANIFSDDPSTQNTVAGRMLNGSSASAAVQAMNAIEQLEAPEAWADKQKPGRVFSMQRREAPREKDRFTILKLSPFDKIGRERKEVSIDESIATRLLGLNGYNTDAKDIITNIDLKGFDENNKEHKKILLSYMRDGINMPGSDGKMHKMLFQSMHKDDDGTVLRMVSEQAMKAVNERYAPVLQSLGLEGNVFNLFQSDKPFSSLNAMRKHSEAINKMWTPSVEDGIGINGKKVVVVSFQENGKEIADGLSWQKGLPYATQNRGALALKGTNQVLGASAIRDVAMATRLATYDSEGNPHLYIPGANPNDKPIDIMDADLIIDKSQIKFKDAFINPDGSMKSNEEINSLVQTLLSISPMAQVKNIDAVRSASSRFGVQAMNFMQLSPEMQKRQMNAARKILQDLQTEEGIIRRVFPASATDELSVMLKNGDKKELLQRPEFQKRVEDKRTEVMRQIASGELILDDLNKEDTISDSVFDASPLAVLFRSMGGVPDDVVQIAQKALKESNGKDYTAEEIRNILTLRGAQYNEDGSLKQRGYVIDQSNSNFDELGIVRFPTALGNFVIANNVAKETKTIFEALKKNAPAGMKLGTSFEDVFNKTHTYIGPEDMYTLSTADYDSDQGKILTGAYKDMLKQSDEQRPHAIESHLMFKAEDLENDGPVSDTPEERVKSAIDLSKESFGMGGPSSVSTGAMQFNKSDPHYQYAFDAAEDANPAYDVMTTMWKNPKKAEPTKAMYAVMKSGREFTRFTERMKDLFSFDEDMLDQDDKVIAGHPDVFTSSDGHMINMRALKNLNIQKINTPSIYEDSHLMAIANLSKFYREGLVDTSRYDAISEAMADMASRYGDEILPNAGSQMKTYYNALNQLMPQFASGQRTFVSDEELSYLSKLRSGAISEIEDWRKSHTNEGDSSVIGFNGETYRTAAAFMNASLRMLGDERAVNLKDKFGFTKGRIEKELTETAQSMLQNASDVSVESSIPAIVEKTLEASAETIQKETKKVVKRKVKHTNKKSLESSNSSVKSNVLNEVESSTNDQQEASAITNKAQYSMTMEEREKLQAEELDKKYQEDENRLKLFRAKLSDAKGRGFTLDGDEGVSFLFENMPDKSQEYAHIAETDRVKAYNREIEDLKKYRETIRGMYATSIPGTGTMSHAISEEEQDIIETQISNLSNKIKEKERVKDSLEIRKERAEKESVLAKDGSNLLNFNDGDLAILSGLVSDARAFKINLWKQTFGNQHKIDGLSDAEIYFDKQMGIARSYYNKLNDVYDNSSKLNLSQKQKDEIQLIRDELLPSVHKEFAFRGIVGAQQMMDKVSLKADKSSVNFDSIKAGLAQDQELIEQYEDYKEAIKKNLNMTNISDDTKELYSTALNSMDSSIEEAKKRLKERQDSDYVRDYENDKKQLLYYDRFDRSNKRQFSNSKLYREYLANQNKYDYYEKYEKALSDKLNIWRNRKETFENNNETDTPKYEAAANAVKDYEKALASCRKEMDGLTGSSGAVNAAINVIGDSVSRVVSQFGHRMFQYAMREAKSFVVEYDSAMTEIQMITLKTDEEIDTLGARFIDVAAKLKTTIPNVTSTATALYRQGLNDEQVNNRIEDIIKFSTTAKIKPIDSTKLVTIAMNNGAVDNATQAIDVVSALGDSAATDAAEITKGLQKTIPAAMQLGMTYQELVAMLTVLTSKTQLGGNIAGTSLKTILSRLSKVKEGKLIYDENGRSMSGDELSKILKLNGIDVYDKNGSMIDPFKIFSQIGNQWNNYDDMQKSQISNALGGTRQFSNIAAVMQGFSEIDDLTGKSLIETYLDIANSSAGITDKKFQHYSDSLEASMATLKTSFDEFLSSINEFSYLSPVLEFVSNAISGFTKWNESMEGVPATIVAITVALGALGALLHTNLPLFATLMAVGGIVTIGHGLYSNTVASDENNIQTKINNDNASIDHAYKLIEQAKQLNTENSSLENKERLADIMSELKKLGFISIDVGTSFEDLTSTVDKTSSTLNDAERNVQQFSDTVSKANMAEIGRTINKKKKQFKEEEAKKREEGISFFLDNDEELNFVHQAMSYLEEKEPNENYPSYNGFNSAVNYLMHDDRYETVATKILEEGILDSKIYTPLYGSEKTIASLSDKEKSQFIHSYEGYKAFKEIIDKLVEEPGYKENYEDKPVNFSEENIDLIKSGLLNMPGASEQDESVINGIAAGMAEKINEATDANTVLLDESYYKFDDDTNRYYFDFNSAAKEFKVNIDKNKKDEEQSSEDILNSIPDMGFFATVNKMLNNGNPFNNMYKDLLHYLNIYEDRNWSVNSWMRDVPKVYPDAWKNLLQEDEELNNIIADIHENGANNSNILALKNRLYLGQISSNGLGLPVDRNAIKVNATKGLNALVGAESPSDAWLTLGNGEIETAAIQNALSQILSEQQIEMLRNGTIKANTEEYDQIAKQIEQYAVQFAPSPYSAKASEYYTGLSSLSYTDQIAQYNAIESQRSQNAQALYHISNMESENPFTLSEDYAYISSYLGMSEKDLIKDMHTDEGKKRIADAINDKIDSFEKSLSLALTSLIPQNILDSVSGKTTEEAIEILRNNKIPELIISLIDGLDFTYSAGYGWSSGDVSQLETGYLSPDLAFNSAMSKNNEQYKKMFTIGRIANAAKIRSRQKDLFPNSTKSFDLDDYLSEDTTLENVDLESFWINNPSLMFKKNLYDNGNLSDDEFINYLIAAQNPYMYKGTEYYNPLFEQILGEGFYNNEDSINWEAAGSNYQQLMSTDSGLSILEELSEIEGVPVLFSELEEAISKGVFPAKELGVELGRIMSNMDSKDLAQLHKAAKNYNEIAEALDDLSTGGEDASNAYMSMYQEIKSLDDLKWATEQYKQGNHSDKKVLSILTHSVSGLDERDLKHATEEEANMYVTMLEGVLADRQAQSSSKLDAMLTAPFKEGVQNIKDMGLEDNLLSLKLNAAVDYSDIMKVFSGTEGAVSQAWVAMVKALSNLGAKFIVSEDDGSIHVDLSGISTGTHHGYGGGGGRKKTSAEKMVERMGHGKSLFDHQLKMVQYQQTKYQNADELGNYGNMLKEEIRLEESYAPVLKNNIQEMKNELSSTKEGTEAWYKLRDAILSAEEQYEEINNNIEENKKKLEENEQAILKLHTDLEQMVVEEIENRKKKERDQLAGTVEMQDLILNTIKQRYQDEWDLIKEDIDKKKEALEKEKDLIDERLEARKEAADESEKYEELAELKKQLASISLDSTRTKDAAALREQISNIEKEIGWDTAEREAENEKDIIQDQIDGYDQYEKQGDEDLEAMLEDANNFSEEVNNVLKMNQTEMIEWLKNNVKEYSASLEDSQKQMIQGWEDTYRQMYGIVLTYWDKVASILSGKNAFLEYMKQSSDYVNASVDEQRQMLYEWEQAYDKWIKAQKHEAGYEHNDPGMGDWSGSEYTDESSGGGYGGGGSNNNKNPDVNHYEPGNSHVNPSKDVPPYMLYDSLGRLLGDYANYQTAESVAIKFSTKDHRGRIIIKDSTGKHIRTIDPDGLMSGGGPNNGSLEDKNTEKHGWGYILHNGDIHEPHKNGYKTREEAQRAAQEAIRKRPGFKYTTKYFETGGIANFTGLAWLDGSPDKPERILSAQQTRSFDSLVSIMDDIKNAGITNEMLRGMAKWSTMVSIPSALSYVSQGSFGGSSATIGDVYVTLNEATINDDRSYDEIANMVGQKFVKEISKQGINVAKYNF